MNILFVCSANVDRSKTAEDFFSEQFIDHDFKSAGTNLNMCRDKGTNPINQELVDEADKIYVMETKHHDWMKENLDTKGKNVEVLNIEDRYSYYSIPLIEILQQKLNSQFE